MGKMRQLKAGIKTNSDLKRWLGLLIDKTTATSYNKTLKVEVYFKDGGPRSVKHSVHIVEK